MMHHENLKTFFRNLRNNDVCQLMGVAVFADVGYWSVGGEFCDSVETAVYKWHCKREQTYTPLLRAYLVEAKENVANVLVKLENPSELAEQLYDLTNNALNNPDQIGLIQDFFSDYTDITLTNPVKILAMACQLLRINFPEIVWSTGVYTVHHMRYFGDRTLAILSFADFYTNSTLVFAR